MSIRVACLSGRLLVAVISLTTMACRGDLVLPTDGSLSRLSAVGGDGQEGTVGTKLPDPLVVRLVDGADQPVSDVSVRFESDGAEIERSVVVTNAAGEASVHVRLGSTEGIQVVDARLEANAEAGPKASFQLTALAPPPDHRDRGRGGDDEDHDDNDD